MISRDGNYKRARVRVRGDQHWHWAYPQKSLKIIMDPEENVSGYQVFNLINEVAPITVGERVPRWLARLLASHDFSVQRVSKYCAGLRRAHAIWTGPSI